MKSEALLAEIQSAFPVVAMPSKADLPFDLERGGLDEYLANELDELRGKRVDGAVIRHVQQEMSCLSAKGWAWILPHYLRYCLTEEAEHNEMETEFLIYHLGPDQKFQADARKRLSLLNSQQIQCLIHFMQWLKSHPHWIAYLLADIDRAIAFLCALQTNQAFETDG